MYLFAQKVRSPKGVEGINAGLYRHDRDDDDPFWDVEQRELVALVTSEEPGRLEWSSLAVVQGGNSVECFLDVIGPNGVDVSEIERAVAALEDRLRDAPPPAIAREGRITAAFGCNIGRSDPLAELQALATRLVDLFRQPPEVKWRAAAPIDVLVAYDDSSCYFRLRDSDAARVVEAGGNPVRVTIRHDVASDFERQHGRMYPFVAEWVTGLERDKLLELGGARFVDGERVLFEWPDRG